MEELNDYTLPSGLVLHLEDAQIEQAQYFLNQFQEMLEEFGDIDLAQYVASELANKLMQHRIDHLGDTPAEQGEKAALKEAALRD